MKSTTITRDQLITKVTDKLLDDGVSTNNQQVSKIVSAYIDEIVLTLSEGDTYEDANLGSLRLRGRRTSQTVTKCEPTVVGQFNINYSVKSKIRTRMNSNPEFFDKLIK